MDDLPVVMVMAMDMLVPLWSVQGGPLQPGTTTSVTVTSPVVLSTQD